MFSFNRKILAIIAFATIFSLSTQISSANPAAGTIPSGALPQAGNFGAIHNHDMMMLKEKQRYLDEKEDFQNFQERKNKKEKVINDESITEEKIYDEETAQKLKEQKELLKKKKQKSPQKTGWFKRKQSKPTQQDETDSDKKKIIEKTDTTTTIEASAQKEANVDGKVYIKAVGVTNSEILSDEEIQQITDSVIGKHISFDDLEKMIEQFNFAYAARGYVTARAFLPPQTIENGVVKVNLVEGKVGDVTVDNNKWTSSNFIKKRITSKPDELFEISVIEQDILKFNKYNSGVKLKANLKKGEKINTTDIELVTEEKFPFHVVAMMDNAGRKTIGEVRGGLMAYSDSLFKQRDRLTIGTYASRYSTTPFVDYNIPVNKYDGKVGFTFSSSFSKIGYGPYKMFDIQSRSYNYALYYSHPLIRKPNFELTSYSAVNYKQASTSFSDYTISTDKVTSFETSLNARYDSKKGIWYLNQGVYQAVPIISDASKYFKYTGSLIRLHDFGHGITGQLRGVYQYSPQDVIPYIDQFQAGGLATVRGYSEGLLIGRSGYILSTELMFPIAPQTMKIKNKKNNEKRVVPFIGKYVKGIAFVDHAGIMPFKGQGPGSSSINQSDYMISMGFGLRISLPGDATARLYWGCPLMHNPHEAYYKNPRFSFELSLAPDIDKLLKMRKRNQENL